MMISNGILSLHCYHWEPKDLMMKVYQFLQFILTFISGPSTISEPIRREEGRDSPSEDDVSTYDRGRSTVCVLPEILTSLSNFSFSLAKPLLCGKPTICRGKAEADLRISDSSDPVEFEEHSSWMQHRQGEGSLPLKWINN